MFKANRAAVAVLIFFFSACSQTSGHPPLTPEQTTKVIIGLIKEHNALVTKHNMLVDRVTKLEPVKKEVKK